MRDRVTDPHGSEHEVITYYSEDTGPVGGPPLRKNFVVLKLLKSSIQPHPYPISVVETQHAESFEDMLHWNVLEHIYVVCPTDESNGIGYYDEERAQEGCDQLNKAVDALDRHYGEANGLSGSLLTFEVVEEWTG